MRGIERRTLILALAAVALAGTAYAETLKTYKDPKGAFSFKYPAEDRLMVQGDQWALKPAPTKGTWTLTMSLQPVSEGKIEDVSTAIQNGLAKQVQGIKFLSHPHPYDGNKDWYTFNCMFPRGKVQLRTEVYVDLVPSQKVAYVFTGVDLATESARGRTAWENVLKTFKTD